MSNARLFKGIVELPILFASIDATNTSGDNTIVAAVAGKKIRGLSLTVGAILATSATLTTSTNPALVFKIGLAANSNFVLPFNELGWFETQVGELLNLAAGTQIVGGLLAYTLV